MENDVENEVENNSRPLFKQTNPKRPNTKGYDKYEKYKLAKSFEEAIELGATEPDITHAKKNRKTHLEDWVTFGGAGFDGGAGLYSDSDEETDNLPALKLTNPNPFLKKLQDLEPGIFIKKVQKGKYSAYTGICPGSDGRHPVILTNEELQRLNEKDRNSYKESLSYGSDPKNQYHYICPRYYCLSGKNKGPISEEQLKKGVCGGKEAIIPQNSKKVPKGKRVFEFINQKGEPHSHPGFLDKSKHPDGLCIPCCFKSWDTKQQRERREACKQEGVKGVEGVEDIEGVEGVEDIEPEKVKITIGKKTTLKITEKDNPGYILGPGKFPLDRSKRGYLNPALSNMLKHNNKKCFNPKKVNALLPNVPCLVRNGSFESKNKSFLGAIMIIYNNIIKKFFIEKPGEYEVSTPNYLINYIDE